MAHPPLPDTGDLPLDEFRARAGELVDWIAEYLFPSASTTQ